MNGQEVQKLVYDNGDGGLYRSAVQSGVHNLQIVTFPASLLKKGKNTLSFTMVSIKEKGGLLWDCLKLEAE